MQKNKTKVLAKVNLGNEVAVVVGTRPGIIKFSPIIRALDQLRIPFFIVHTGQHYSYNMDKQFFDELELPAPRFTNDNARRQTLHGAQTAEMIKAAEQAFVEAKPKAVIVGGDANTNLAGALAARKLGITLAHLEAGLRSDDWSMPEEHNRVMIDHISEILLAPTERARQNLVEDNVKGKIHVVGNPIVDAVYQNRKIARTKSTILEDHNLVDGEYFLLTFHREENLYNHRHLQNLIQTIEKILEQFENRVVFPMHPHTLKRLTEAGLSQRITEHANLTITNALGYIDFLRLLSSARLVLTDSGGIQEESCILQIPCVTLRENTERPETVEAGANLITGTEFDRVRQGMDAMLAKERTWDNPFGDGKAAERIATILSEL